MSEEKTVYFMSGFMSTPSGKTYSWRTREYASSMPLSEVLSAMIATTDAPGDFVVISFNAVKQIGGDQC